MMAQDLTKFTIVIVLLGVILAIAVFRPQILPAGAEGPAHQTMPVGELTPTPAPERPNVNPPSETGEADLTAETPEAQRRQLAEEWESLRVEREKLDNEKMSLEAGKAELAREWDSLKAAQAELARGKEAFQVEQAQLAGEWGSLEAERAALAEEKQDLQAGQALVEERWRELQVREADLLAEKQRVERLHNLTVLALSAGSLISVLIIILAVVVMWREKRARTAARPIRTPELTDRKRGVHPHKVPTPTYGGNGKGKKEVIRIG